MAQYYYLVASLPYLHFREKPPLSLADFLAQASPWLSEDAFRQLKLARIDIENIQSADVKQAELKKWITFENSLRIELVKIRAGVLNVQAEPFLKPQFDADPAVWSAVKEAVKDPSPYKSELALVELRWKFLENLETGHHFDLAFLIIYALKLQLQGRVEKFDAEKGQKVFHIIYEGNKDEEERKYRDNNRD